VSRQEGQDVSVLCKCPEAPGVQGRLPGARKGLGSGALTGANRIPELAEDEGEAKVLESWADTKRIVAEIIDAIRYKDIEKPNFVTVHFLDYERSGQG